MRAEYAPVGVAFVNNDIVQMTQQPTPLLVVCGYPSMKHVGIAEDKPGMIANAAAYLCGSIAVIGGGVNIIKSANGVDQGVSVSQLIGA